MRNFTDLMTSNKQLCQLRSETRRFRKIEAYLYQVLPVYLVAHTGLLSYENDILVIQADNSTWAGKIRFFLPQLTRDLKKINFFKSLIAVKVKTKPRYQPVYTAKKANRKTLSANAKDSLLKTAEAIQDTSLKDALRKLARH